MLSTLEQMYGLNKSGLAANAPAIADIWDKSRPPVGVAAAASSCDCSHDRPVAFRDGLSCGGVEAYRDVVQVGGEQAGVVIERGGS